APPASRSIPARRSSDLRVVDAIRTAGFSLTVGDVTFRLAREFGFCYGVDRAVEYAYETRTKFPAKRTFLVGEIIHNPHVNAKLRSEEHTSELQSRIELV